MVLGVIPARFKSSRFPGKPLVKILGVEMIKRTYMQAKNAKTLDKLVVATDDKRIFDFCKQENLEVVITSESHLTGTDRITEVAHKINADFYVNIQGDEPIIDHRSIDEIVNFALDSHTKGKKYEVFNLYKNISPKEAQRDSIVKVVVNENDELVFMSRFPIPFSKSFENPNYKKQVAVYVFSAYALKLFEQSFKTHGKGINERFEDIEILRFIDMGEKVKMLECFYDSISVDEPCDVNLVEKWLTLNKNNV